MRLCAYGAQYVFKVWLHVSNNIPLKARQSFTNLILRWESVSSTIFTRRMSASGPDDATQGTNPLVRHALRVLLSASEYSMLHEQINSRAPESIQRALSLPTPARFEAMLRRPKDRYIEASVRASLRVFFVSGALLKIGKAVSRSMQRGASR